MRSNVARFLQVSAGLSGLMLLGWALTLQAAKPVPRGIALPTDWSHRHLIFSNPSSEEKFARVSADERFRQQLYRHLQPVAVRKTSENAVEQAHAALSSSVRTTNTSKGLNGLWSEDLGNGANPGSGNYPARFSANSSVENCATATQPDFVVFSTGILGSSTQAEIVAYDNLYATCSGGHPTTYWAFNTGGAVLTSPVISQDGKQVAFVESNGGFGILVVLKYKGGSGTASSPTTLSVTPASSYGTCTAPCMTQVLLAGGGTHVDDQTSSLFYDYQNDIGWVGGNGGWLHKVTGIFKGVPTETSNGTFPVLVNKGISQDQGNLLYSPVYDSSSKSVFVSDAGGYFFRVSSTTGTVTATPQLDFGTGLVDGPIVDSTNNLVYVFSSSDGSTSCTGGTACAAIYEFTTTFAAGTSGTNKRFAGQSVVFGNTPNPMHIGDFDDAYYNSADATGNLYACGNTGANPIVYRFPVTAGALQFGSTVVTLVAAGTSPECSPITDIPNASLGEERFYVSVQNGGVGANCATAGCLMSFIDSPWQAGTAYSVGQEILDSNRNIETVTTAGTSGSSAPTWSTTAGGATTDGTVHWVNQFTLSATPLSSWTRLTGYVPGNRIIDSNNMVEIAVSTGTSNSSAPTFSKTPGVTTPDGNGSHAFTWINAGANPTASLASSGGASGIVYDNPVTAGANSQIYFSTLGNQTCATSGGTGGCAVQASQSGLN